MHPVHLRDLDLNLLLTLDALLSESHVTRAARRVGLSQSAMSHALSRLREKLDDPLLVRTPRGMEQTVRAQALAGPLRAALLELDRAIAPPTPFDPRTAVRTFQLSVSDYEELTLMRPLLRRLGQEAPGVNLVLRPSSAHDWAALLARGELELALRPAANDGDHE
ncbi:MAG TPA: LysR family transcriptional regulator, partial [Polyangiales bacterium]